MKYRHLILVLALAFLSTGVYSQKWKLAREEIAYGIGTVNYFGDIGGAKNPEASAIADLDFAYTRPNLSIAYRYRLLERVAAKGSFIYANFHGSDIGSQNEARNYTFSTNMFQLYGHVEYHITPEKSIVNYSKMSLRGGLDRLNAGLNVYVFLGLGASYAKPKAKDSFVGSERYVGNKNFSLSFPVGIGLKYPIGPTTYVGFEFSGSFTTTDYIDGFNSATSTSKDLYYFSVIYVSHKVKKKQKRGKLRF